MLQLNILAAASQDNLTDARDGGTLCRLSHTISLSQLGRPGLLS